MTARIHYLFFGLSIYLTLAVFIALLEFQTFFTIPGYFLFDRFHLAAFYIPVTFFAGGIWLKKRHLPTRLITILWFSPLVFITFSIALQVALGRTNLMASRELLNVLGRIPASLLFFMLFALEILIIVRLSVQSNSDSKAFSVLQQVRQKVKKVLIYLNLADPVYEEAIAQTAAHEHSATSDPLFSAMPISMSPLNTNAAHTPEPSFSDVTVSGKITSLDNLPEEEEQVSLSQKLSPLGTTPSGHFRQEAVDKENSEEVNEFVQIDFRNYRFSEEDSASDQSHSADKDLPTGSQIAERRIKKHYEIPVDGILAAYPDSDYTEIDEATHIGSRILEQTLSEFKIEAKVTGIRKGPVITLYELLPSPGVKISSIVNLQDNIALRLAASRVRIVAPIPGKHAVGIEVPNKKRSIVSFSTMVRSDEFREMEGIPVILGKDISGENQVIDLTRTPHLLIAGATGSGKSVCVNSLIASILYSRNPQEIKLVMVDPKIVELKLYNGIPHLLAPVITEPKRAIQALQWCLYEMERRYALLDSQGVRDMMSYNKRIVERRLATESLPYIVVIVDEFADLMAVSGKELEVIVARLAAMSRAVGIHLVLATQRPSVDVITGLIKANFPSRIAFMVAQKTDSRIIIDAMGAEKLLGKGDMLFTSAWDPFPFRIQGAYLSEEEVERVVDCVKEYGEPDYIEDEMFFADEDDEDNYQMDSSSGDDPMYEKALEIVIHSRKASASYLQRRLKIGYNRAARLIEEMEHRGIVGPANGSKAREILHVPEIMRQEEESA